MSISPKLRTVSKSPPPFPINEFPKNFPFLLGKELIYVLASKDQPTLEGNEWEAIFARCIGATWKPSNVGLDDITLGNTAWGAKTVKTNGKAKPSNATRVRLISGRNSPYFSFDGKIDRAMEPNGIGQQVLHIWNDRVSAVREKYDNLRTVVLIKSADLTEVVVFEFETIRYDPELFYWEWNTKNNLEGYSKATKEHKFTWQPSGSQFTIMEHVTEKNVVVQVRKPPELDRVAVLNTIGVDNSWVTVTNKGAR